MQKLAKNRIGWLKGSKGFHAFVFSSVSNLKCGKSIGFQEGGGWPASAREKYPFSFMEQIVEFGECGTYCWAIILGDFLQHPISHFLSPPCYCPPQELVSFCFLFLFMLHFLFALHPLNFHFHFSIFIQYTFTFPCAASQWTWFKSVESRALFRKMKANIENIVEETIKKLGVIQNMQDKNGNLLSFRLDPTQRIQYCFFYC